MTLVNIDLRNQGYETGPDDRVVFYSLLVREGDFGTISTAPVEVELVDGKATVGLAPGPVGVQIIAGQVADTRVKIGEVPSSGPTTLGAVMMVTPAYTPALQEMMIAAVGRAKEIALTEVDSEVAKAVSSEVGEFKTKAEQALTKSTAAESKSDAALSKSTTAESSASNAVSRVEALEVMGGLTPGEPADGQTANLIEQPSTLTRGAVRAASVEVVHESAPVITVGPFGQYQTASDWNVSTGTDDYAVIQSAIDACPIGGTVHLDFRGRDTYCSQTLVIDKPIKITSGTTTDVSGRLWFPMHKTGFIVQAPQSGGPRPSNVVLENLYIRGPIPTAHAPSDTEGVGIHVKDGKVHFRDIIVQFMSGHGLYIQAGAQHDHYGDGRYSKGGNVTKSQFDNIRVANVWGDGIKLHGTDTQACLFVKPDMAACRGWGLNVDTANINQFIMPHFDQRASEKGMIRDCANSNDYGFIYAETGGGENLGGLILLDKTTERESLSATFEVATYASLINIVDNTTAKSANFFRRGDRTQRRSFGITSINEQHSFQFDSGGTGASSFTLRYFPGADSAYGPGNMSIFNHNLALDATTFYRNVRMQGQLRLAVVNPPETTRPNAVNVGAGTMMFDSSIGKIIVSNGSAWTDGAGNPL